MPTGHLPIYPDTVTLTATVSAQQILTRIDTSSPDYSVKNSFACLDLVAANFDVLVDTRWIYRAADHPAPTPPRHVRSAPVHTPNTPLV